MLQYKTKSIPHTILRGVNKKEYRTGLSDETLTKAVAPIGTAISIEAKKGWILHSINSIPQRIARKRGFFELLFGWIPILGHLLFPSLEPECKTGEIFEIYVLTFVREV